MKQLKKTLCLMLCAAMILSTVVIPADVNAAAKIKLSAKSVTLTVGKTKTLTLKQGKKKVKGVKWKTSNKKVATVSSSGKIKAKKVGKANITATYKKKKYVCKVTVKANKTTSNTNNNNNSSNNNSNNDSSTKAPVYAISQTSVSVEVENSAKLTVTKDGSTVSYGITWASGNTNIVTVSYGTVKAVGPGTTTVTATIDGNVFTCNVTVTVPDYQMSASNISLDTADKDNRTYQLEVMNGLFSVEGATWNTSDADVATVDENGLVTAAGAGDATITAKKYGKECSCTLTVEGFVFERDVTIVKGTREDDIEFVVNTNNITVAELEAQGYTIKTVNNQSVASKHVKSDTAKYTFSRLPKTLQEIKQIPLDTKFGPLAASICAIASYDTYQSSQTAKLDQLTYIQAFEYLNGPNCTFSNYERQNSLVVLNNAYGWSQSQKISGSPYMYFDGVNNLNQYKDCGAPYTFTVYEGPYYIPAKASSIAYPNGTPERRMIFIKAEGADTERYIDTYYSTIDQCWYSWEEQCMHLVASMRGASNGGW